MDATERRAALIALSRKRRRSVKPPAPQPPDALARKYEALISRVHTRILIKFVQELMRAYGVRTDAKVPYGLTKHIADIFTRFGEIFLDELGPLFAKMTVDIDSFNKDQFDGMFKRAIGIPFADKPGTAPFVASLRNKNVDLIKTLSRGSMDRVKALLDDNEGAHANDLAKLIAKEVGTTDSHARLLARDQTLKLNGELTKHRQTEAGITRYEWSTSNDDRVRPMHRDLDGQAFEWSHPPVVSKDGRREPPGLDYQCRCVAIPIINLDAL